MMIPFFITIDTEGDSLWDNPPINHIKTENVTCIPRFQELCEKYHFIPIWLTDYEIISDNRFVDYIKEKNRLGLCEVGIHVHARNNPPIVSLQNEREIGAAYLIEYPTDVMEEKIGVLINEIETKLDCKIKTHRAGRWTINKDYIDILSKYDIKYDCSVTPGIDWSGLEGITPGSKGSDHSQCDYSRQIVLGNKTSLVEYPVTIMPCKRFNLPDSISLKTLARSGVHYVKKQQIWLRPNTNGNLNEMKYLLNVIKKNNLEYAEFMIHSSEFMPGGGPKHQGKQEVDLLFNNIEEIFKYASKLGFVGHTFDSWEKVRKDCL